MRSTAACSSVVRFSPPTHLKAKNPAGLPCGIHTRKVNRGGLSLQCFTAGCLQAWRRFSLGRSTKLRLTSKAHKIMVNISHFTGRMLMSNFYQALENSFTTNLLGDALRLADGTVWRYQHLLERVNDIARTLVQRGYSLLIAWLCR